MKARQKEKIKHIIQGKKLVPYVYVDRNNNYCIIGALLSAAGIPDAELMKRANRPLCELPRDWLNLLYERFGLSPGLDYHLQAINDRSGNAEEREINLMVAVGQFQEEPEEEPELAVA